MTRRLFVFSTIATAFPFVAQAQTPPAANPDDDPTIPHPHQTFEDYFEKAVVWLDQHQHDPKELKRSITNIAVHGTKALNFQFTYSASRASEDTPLTAPKLLRNKVDLFGDLLITTYRIITTTGRGIIMACNLNDVFGQSFDPKPGQRLLLELYPNQIPESDKKFSDFYDQLQKTNRIIRKGSSSDAETPSFFDELSWIDQNPEELPLPDLDAALRKLHHGFEEKVLTPLTKVANALVEEKKVPRRQGLPLQHQQRTTDASNADYSRRSSPVRVL